MLGVPLATKNSLFKGLFIVLGLCGSFPQQSDASVQCHDIFMFGRQGDSDPFLQSLTDSPVVLPPHLRSQREVIHNNLLVRRVQGQINILDFNLHKQLRSQITNWVQNIGKILNVMGVEYEIFWRQNLQMKMAKLEWPAIRVSSTGDHWLNRYVRETADLIDTKLVIDPIYFFFTDASGLFDFSSGEAEIIVPENVLGYSGPNHFLRHEMIHGIFYFRRKTSTVDPIYPVNISFYAKNGIMPNATRVTSYDQAMGFDEMITFGHNVGSFAQALQSRLPLTSVQALIYRNQLLAWIERHYKVSRNARVAAAKAQNILKKDATFLIAQTEPGALFVISDLDGTFRVELHVPSFGMVNSFSYVQNELERARLFAQFNHEYFDHAEEMPFEELVELAARLEQAQADFLRSLD